MTVSNETILDEEKELKRPKIEIKFSIEALKVRLSLEIQGLSRRVRPLEKENQQLLDKTDR